MRWAFSRNGVASAIFPRANVGFAEVVIGVEILWLELDGLAELFFGGSQFSQADEIGGKIGSGRRGSWIEANSLFEVFVGLGVLRFGGIDRTRAVRGLRSSPGRLGEAFPISRRLPAKWPASYWATAA